MAQEARDKKEREKLYAAIESSSTVGRQLVNLDEPSNYFTDKKATIKADGSVNGHATGKEVKKTTRGSIDEAHARDARDEALVHTPSISRPESPFTQHPTIDFDGLSWPSMFLSHAQQPWHF
jgi:GTP cyclohydrolase I